MYRIAALKERYDFHVPDYIGGYVAEDKNTLLRDRASAEIFKFCTPILLATTNAQALRPVEPGRLTKYSDCADKSVVRAIEKQKYIFRRGTTKKLVLKKFSDVQSPHRPGGGGLGTVRGPGPIPPCLTASAAKKQKGG